ncbi:hypothetical protein QLL95_gp0315 [Cotonvirus japonicus]|uniref:2OG-Fe(II) oxygenase n=1 Tax=Cotonvirus japonicus TaxID=2811091 RepID=A0ABM7NRM5_9VIRU|nr:hypothetical protein QLL95_gp0315 [Cotonvirus japonicus]BCS82804.1 hypothetical protein [Cotonvirus japonicus]
MKGTFTITFGDQAENHVGMQKIGSCCNSGLSLEDFFAIRKCLSKREINCEIIDLNHVIQKIGIYPDEEAYLLIIRNGVNLLLEDEDANNNLFDELSNLSWDTKALMYGRVVNKNARYNLCFNDVGQKPNYELGQGTITAFKKVPLLSQLRECMINLITPINTLVAEGNYYYDTTKCGIGFHGDSERKIVIGVRIGESMKLVYQWYKESKPIGEIMTFNFNSGDIYIMSEKAVGTDWKCRSKYTLRHAAGCDKFIKKIE